MPNKNVLFCTCIFTCPPLCTDQEIFHRGRGRGEGGYEWSFFQPGVGAGLGLGGRQVSGLVQGLIANLDNFNNHINLIILKFPWAPLTPSRYGQ